jgi:hypothetical protein
MVTEHVLVVAAMRHARRPDEVCEDCLTCRVPDAVIGVKIRS